MGLFDRLKFAFMSDDDKVKLAGNPNTPKDILIKLCKYDYDNNKVIEAVASNPSTPKEALVEGLVETIMHKKKSVRESAIQAISKAPNDAPFRIPLALRLVELLRTCDWYRSIDIVRALGIMRSRIASDTICSLVGIALRELDTYVYEEASYSLEGEIIKIDTDTDSLPMMPSQLFSAFLNNAVRALHAIGDPDAKDTLKSVLRNEHTKNLRWVAKSALDKIEKGKDK